MTGDRKRRYQCVTSGLTLKSTVGMPPLSMTLLGGLEPEAGTEAEDGALAGQGNVGATPFSGSAKERAVRRIIEHLKKQP